MMCAVHAKRNTLQNNDMWLMNKLRKRVLPSNYKSTNCRGSGKSIENANAERVIVSNLQKRQAQNVARDAQTARHARLVIILIIYVGISIFIHKCIVKHAFNPKEKHPTIRSNAKTTLLTSSSLRALAARRPHQELNPQRSQLGSTRRQQRQSKLF
ncbi:hypothetical protein BDR26DRAFT_995467 [Obelidium mucronatum]|nr:hypothetical protein BDR26DRAFT_995467 [Obelidium mucronatum]